MSEYISREEFEKRIKPYDTEDHTDKALYNFAHNNMICCPSADVRPNTHGHWGRLTRVENVYSIDGVRTWGIKCQCDKCTFTTIVVEGFGFYDYCPHCGSRNEVEADMREPKGEKGTE